MKFVVDRSRASIRFVSSSSSSVVLRVMLSYIIRLCWMRFIVSFVAILLTFAKQRMPRERKKRKKKKEKRFEVSRQVHYTNSNGTLRNVYVSFFFFFVFRRNPCPCSFVAERLPKIIDMIANETDCNRCDRAVILLLLLVLLLLLFLLLLLLVLLLLLLYIGIYSESSRGERFRA